MIPYRQAVEDRRRQFGRFTPYPQTHGNELSTGIAALVLWLMLASH